MTYIAVLGYGTIGSGVVELMEKNNELISDNAKCTVAVKKILDLKDFTNQPIQEKITHSFDEILNDSEIKVIAEVMGGVEPAYTYTKKALMSGKSVVTANKELVAKHGAELLALAEKHSVNYLFEASVAGGIPIIRAMRTSISADAIHEISGILNGTTNYILTKMTNDNKSFDEALKSAQEKGYAERNPDADILGHDACRKIAILLSLVTKSKIASEDIHTEGITNISKMDIAYAKKLGYNIKLIARGQISQKGVSAMVAPFMVTGDCPLSMVNGVFNAVLLQGGAIGELMFYGKGAGKLATATAVCADIIDAIKHLNINLGYTWSEYKESVLPFEDEAVGRLIRIAFNSESAIAVAKELFHSEKVIFLDDIKDEFALLTNAETEQELAIKKRKLIESGYVTEIRGSIRVL